MEGIMEESTMKGVIEFLEGLPPDEVYGLLKTTTGGLIAATTVPEAISIIIKYSDAVALLNRRRVKKDYLIKYLQSKNVGFPLAADKTKLCRIILNYWGDQNCKTLDFIDTSLKKSQESQPSTSKGGHAVRLPTSLHATLASSSNVVDSKKTSQLKPDVSQGLSPAATGFIKYFKTGVSPGQETERCKKESKSSTILSKPASSSTLNSQKKQVTFALTPTVIPTLSCSTMTDPMLNQCQESQTEVSHQLVVFKDAGLYTEEESMDIEECLNQRQIQMQTGQQLGDEFTPWFYNMLNSLTGFGPHHFWPECNLRIEYIAQNNSENRHIQEILHNGEKCYEEMKQLILMRQLSFNPNLIPRIGVRGKINPHGLAQVMACGTIFHLQSVVGVFEQVFGLMMDPRSGNNYKIKFSLLRLREGNCMINGMQHPSLCDTSLAGIVEEVDSEEEDLQGID